MGIILFPFASSLHSLDIQAALYELCWHVVQGNFKLDLAASVLSDTMVCMALLKSSHCLQCLSSQKTCHAFWGFCGLYNSPFSENIDSHSIWSDVYVVFWLVKTIQNPHLSCFCRSTVPSESNHTTWLLQNVMLQPCSKF